MQNAAKDALLALLHQGQREAADHQRIMLIATHTSPDGDAVGSAFALAHVALAFSLSPLLYFPDALPESFTWLEQPCPLVHNLTLLRDKTIFALACVDCGDAKRPGPPITELLLQRTFEGQIQQLVHTINIDHHCANPLFADVNWVESSKAATGELIGELAETAGLTLSGGLGQAIYLALVADTGKFTYPSTSAETFAMAGRILAAGLDLQNFTVHFDNTWSLQRTHLWGELLRSTQLTHNGKTAYCIVRHALLKQYQCNNYDLEGFASQLNRIQGVKLALLIREDSQQMTKISLRSTNRLDTQAIAAQFGGGGHVNASGAVLHLSAEKTLRVVLERIGQEYLEGA